MNVGQDIYYIDTYAPNDEAPGDQMQFIQEGKFLAEGAKMTAIVTVPATGRSSDHLGGLVIFVPNNQVTEYTHWEEQLKIAEAIMDNNS